MARLAWPLGWLLLFAGLFGGVMSTGAYETDVFDVQLVGDVFNVEYDVLVGPRRGIRLPVGARLLRDVPYGSHRLQKIDVYLPPGAGAPVVPVTEEAEAGAPMVFMVHGGGWQRGDKRSPGVVQNKINYFLPKGYVFVSVNYRLSPEIDPTVQAEDVAAALAYVQRHAHEWGGDGGNVLVMGHSAGAHLVSMLTAASEIGEAAGIQPWSGTVSLDSAAYNVVELMRTRHRSTYDRAFGADPQFWALASPALRLTQTPPPMLLVCSTLWAHSCQQATEYAAAVRELGGTATLHRVVMRHNEVNRRVGLPGPLTDAVADFMQFVGLP